MELAWTLDRVKGIGPKTAEAFERAGVRNVQDLLYYLPREYENYEAPISLAEARPGKITVKARVGSIKTDRKRRNLSLTEAILRDESGAMRAVWFNQPYRAKQFEEGREYYFAGDFEFSRGRYQLMNPSATLASDYDGAAEAFKPVYPVRGGLKPAVIKKALNVLKPAFAEIPENLPVDGIMSRGEALFRVHFPTSAADVAAGRGRLAFEELFELILASQLNKQQNQKLKAEAVGFDAAKVRRVVGSLAFRLTNAQRRATWEIIQDMGRELPMNRLLQGDVGSGKTVVAGLAAYVASVAGFQSVLMAPTEILATQHAETLHNLLAPFGVRIALLTGSTKNKATLKKQIVAGEVDLVIGTHAVITEDTHFKRLALAIIDEQHRFGVAQRQKLLMKGGRAPHLLSMTATPIPRSLQLTIFGDLDVSVLDELPAGRKVISTSIVSPNSLAQLFEAVENELVNGRQAYYICKMIEWSAVSNMSDVKAEAERLRRRFRGRRVEYLHGKMKAEEKERIMAEFVEGSIDVLVSTTVVEVGVNVPNATVMIIADADKYGLSQLHQLRGRVGRGEQQSYCYLINSDSTKPSRRLVEIERSMDGFHLAEVDLRMRGPGEIYGALQHGALDLRIASITDTKLVAEVSRAVKEFLQSGKDLIQYPELAAAVRKYQRLTTLN
jgi:ATP-dependent DNA helicase RecG